MQKNRGCILQQPNSRRGANMGELYELYPKLPKNIRQIGERDTVLRLYVEDYVNTYLKRLKPGAGQSLRVGLLLGSREIHEDMPYVFVDGAMEMELLPQDGEKVVFTEEAWKKAYQQVETMFPRRTVQGWFLCAGEGVTLSPLNYWRQHSQYFTGKNQLMYLNSGLDGEEAVYITSSDGFYQLRGYSIYYERNQLMQDYMIARKDILREESKTDDRAIRDFRKKMDEHRTAAVHQRSTVNILSGLCSVLAVMVLAGGVAMFNNYKKLHEMEQVMASADPASLIREARGGVYPREGKEESQEKAMEVLPETMVTGNEMSGAETGTLESRSNSTDAFQSEQTQQSLETDQESAPETTTAGVSVETTAASAEPANSTPSYKVYVVGEGETLYGICFKEYNNIRKLEEICRINSLTDENSIYAGQKLLLP
jgi:LysM repeat protein